MRHGKAHVLPALAAVGALLRRSGGLCGGALAAAFLIAFAAPAMAQSGYLNYGQVSTASPNYSGNVGNNEPLSLDTFGGVRVNCIEGCSSSSGPVNGEATTAAPTYTDSTVNPLSLDLSGFLRTTSEEAGSAAGGAAAGSSLLTGGIFNSTAPSLTNGEQAAMQLGSNGALNVNVVQGGGTGGTASSFGATFPGSGTAVGMSQSGNMVALTGTSGSLNVDCTAGCNASSDTANGPVSPGTAATNSKLGGLVFNTTEPTLSNAQQVALQGDSHGNLLVNLDTALPTGDNPIGQVGGNTVTVAAAPTVTAAAYTSGECVGGLLQFSNAARSGGPGSGLVQSAVITDVSGQDANIDVIIFKADPTNSTFTDHSTCSVNNADLAKIAGVIHVTDCALLGATAPGVCQAQQQAVPIALGAGNTTLYAVNISRGTPTYTASTNLNDMLQVLQD